MNNCKACGHELKEGTIFCTQCGAKTEAAQPPVEQAPVVEQPAAPAEQPAAQPGATYQAPGWNPPAPDAAYQQPAWAPPQDPYTGQANPYTPPAVDPAANTYAPPVPQFQPNTYAPPATPVEPAANTYAPVPGTPTGDAGQTNTDAPAEAQPGEAVPPADNSGAPQPADTTAATPPVDAPASANTYAPIPADGAQPPVVPPQQPGAPVPPDGQPPKKKEKTALIILAVALAVVVLAGVIAGVLLFQGNDVPVDSEETSLAGESSRPRRDSGEEPDEPDEPDEPTTYAVGPGGTSVMEMDGVPVDYPVYAVNDSGAYLVSTSGGYVKVDTDDDYVNYYMTYDGSKCFYLADKGDYDYELYATDFSGEPRLVAEDVSRNSLYVLPDNDTVYYTDSSSGSSLYSYSFSGGESTLIGSANQYAVSPNGAFVLAGDYSKMYLQDNSGGSVQWIEDEGANAYPVAVANDGSIFVYSLRDGDDFSMVFAGENGVLAEIEYDDFEAEIYSNKDGTEYVVLSSTGLYRYVGGEVEMIDDCAYDSTAIRPGQVLGYSYTRGGETYVLNTDSFANFYYVAEGSRHAAGNDVGLYYRGSDGQVREIYQFVGDYGYGASCGISENGDYAFVMDEDEMVRLARSGDSFTEELITDKYYSYEYTPDGEVVYYSDYDNLYCFDGTTTRVVADEVDSFWIGGPDGHDVNFITYDGYDSDEQEIGVYSFEDDEAKIITGDACWISPMMADGSFYVGTNPEWSGYSLESMDLAVYSGGELTTVLRGVTGTSYFSTYGNDLMWYYDLTGEQW